MSQQTLSGKTILLARAPRQTAGLRNLLNNLGAHCESLPLFTISAIRAQPAYSLENYNGLIYTSRNAVIHGPKPAPASSTCLAVGPGTADELMSCGVGQVIVPEDTRSEGLLSLSELQDVWQQRWLIVKGRGGRDIIRRELVKRGANVETVAVYERIPIPLDQSMIEASISQTDAIIFFSGEGLQRLVEVCPGTLRKRLFSTPLVVPSVRVVKMAKDIGFNHQVCPAGRMSDNGLVTAVAEALAGDRPVNHYADENEKP